MSCHIDTILVKYAFFKAATALKAVYEKKMREIMKKTVLPLAQTQREQYNTRGAFFLKDGKCYQMTVTDSWFLPILFFRTE